MSDATLQHWVPSPDAIAAAPMKKKGQKRPRDDPSASENPETVPDEAGATDWAEVVEPSQKKKKSNDQQSLAEGSAEARGTDVTDRWVGMDQPMGRLLT